VTAPRLAAPALAALAMLLGSTRPATAGQAAAPAAAPPRGGVTSSKPDLPQSVAPAIPPGAAPAAPGQGPGATGRFEKDGVVIDFSFAAQEGGGTPREGELADVRFKVTDAASGAPVRGLSPAVWLDVAGSLSGGAGGAMECKEKIALYLKGLVGIRPVVDLNSYFLLVLNQDPSISVIDPVVSMTGKTSLFATILLPRPGADWVTSPDEKRLYVSMPLMGHVAVIDAETFQLTSTIPAGDMPTRLALSQSGRLLVVGNDARASGTSGVTLVDLEAGKALATIATGAGHHEVALSADERQAFVTNRTAGTVSVIDVEKRAKVKDLPVGPTPISIGWSSLSQRVYVAEAKEGRIAVIDPVKGEVSGRIKARSGLGPMRFSEDGRWAFVVNSTEHVVHVVDASQDRKVHDVRLVGKPYQVTVTRAFAYVRLLDSEKVQMINLSSLGKSDQPIVNAFAAGERAPKAAGELSLADAITPAATDAAVFVNSPAEGLVYFYMEGMNAPMGNFSSYGHRTAAVTVIDRTVRELEPGVYGASVRVPSAARYDLAFLLDNPRILHCFSAEALENPALASSAATLRVEYLDTPQSVALGASLDLRFRILDGHGQPKTGAKDVAVTYYQPPGARRAQVLADHAGEGVYQARLALPAAGPWYLQVTAPSLGGKPDNIPFRSLVVTSAARKP